MEYKVIHGDNMLSEIIKTINDMESDIDNIDTESVYHYYVVEYDGINQCIVISIVEAFEVYDADVDIYHVVENRPDFISKINNVSDDMFINVLIDYIDTQYYNLYESLIKFKGSALY